MKRLWVGRSRKDSNEMKPGVRILGIAESFQHDRSTLAGAIVSADGRIDGFGLGSCTVGGMDATESIVSLIARIDRDDVRYVVIAGFALAWFNIVDLERVAREARRPVVSVTFEASNGLEDALREHFSGRTLTDRLETYRSQPERHRIVIDDTELYVRTVDITMDDTVELLTTITPSGGRPEPLRVANLLARAVDQWSRQVGNGSRHHHANE